MPVQPWPASTTYPYDAGAYGRRTWPAARLPTHAGRVTKQETTDESHASDPQLSLCFASTRRGARLARRLAVQQFTEWTGLTHDCGPAYAVALVTAELASNAITHGHLPGRDFRLTLLLLPRAVRVEVTDTRPERPVRRPGALSVPPGALSGRGLLLVTAYAERWGCETRDAYTKTVWAEVPVAPGTPRG